MPNTFEGSTKVTSSDRFAIVVARWNDTITSRLLEGALATLGKHDVPSDAIDVCWVPGAFEIPTVAARLAAGRRYAAVLCLGAVIRGATTHDQHINSAVSNQLAEIGVRTGVPTLFGILTCDTLEQAIQRAGGIVGNKGSECAEAALQMADLLNKLPS